MARGYLAAAALLLVDAAAATSSPVKHIVLLQLENRAFDHMLGWLTRNNSEIVGLHNQSNPIDPLDPSSQLVYVTDLAAYTTPDPGHSLGDTSQQIFGFSNGSGVEQMNGFVANAIIRTQTWGAHVMDCFAPQDVPIITTLASEFALIDNLFSFVGAETFPNRVGTLSGTSYGYVANDDNITIGGWPQKPIFAALDEASVDWRVYFDEVSTAWLFQYTRTLEQLKHFHEMSTFFTDVAAGDLASFTYIDPGFFDFGTHNATDQHPGHDVVNGEMLMKSVYEALRASPAWNQTVLWITYDEHGGMFDSVPPPSTGVPKPDDQPCHDCPFPFAFERLGVRIPFIAISPWIPKGQVIHAPPPQFVPTPTSQMELSSIPATLHHVFNTSAFLTARDAWASPLHWMWDPAVTGMTEPRTDCPLTLPPAPTQSPSFVGRVRQGINPMSALHEDLLTLTQALTGLASNPSDAYAQVAASGIETEAEAGMFVQRAIKRLLHKQPVTADMMALRQSANTPERKRFNKLLDEYKANLAAEASV